MNRKSEKPHSHSPLGIRGLHTRHFENLHIPLWLMKDTCWLLQWKLLGVAMIAPTLGVAIAIAIKTFREDEFWINLAICFWISANAYWMCCEFFNEEAFKGYAIYPFVVGFISVAMFYVKRTVNKNTVKAEDYF
jgi:hypothetical protein